MNVDKLVFLLYQSTRRVIEIPQEMAMEYEM